MSESHLRQLLADAAELAPTSLARPAHRRSRWQPRLAVAASVLSVLGIAAVVAITSTSTPKPPTATGPQPGMQEVFYRGLTLDVPEEWSTGKDSCGTPVENTVLFDGGSNTLCIAVSPPGLSVVDITGPEATGLPCTPGDSGTCTVQGDAYRGSGTREITVVTPNDGVGYAVIAALDPDIQRSIVTSVRSVSSYLDCPVHNDHLGPAAPTRTGAAEHLVPGDPTSVTVCRYVSGELVNAATLSSPTLTGWLPVLNGLQTGLGRPPASAGFPQVGDPRCSGEDGKWFRIRFGYPNGSPLDLWLRLQGCGNVVGYDNGARTGFSAFTSVKPVLDAVGTEGGYHNLDGNIH